MKIQSLENKVTHAECPKCETVVQTVIPDGACPSFNGFLYLTFYCIECDEFFDAKKKVCSVML